MGAGPCKTNPGNLRQTFFLNHVKYENHRNSGIQKQVYHPDSGDFLIDTFDHEYFFEIGAGENQTANFPAEIIIMSDTFINKTSSSQSLSKRTLRLDQTPGKKSDLLQMTYCLAKSRQ